MSTDQRLFAFLVCLDRQAAVYGVGVCAEYGGAVFRPLVGGKLFYLCIF